MPTWPATLPQSFNVAGFRDELPEQLVRSRIGAPGAEKTRRPARRNRVAPMRGQMTMTTDEWLELEEWRISDIAGGALSFDFPDPDDASITIRVFMTRGPSIVTIGGELHTVNFTLLRKG